MVIVLFLTLILKSFEEEKVKNRKEMEARLESGGLVFSNKQAPGKAVKISYSRSSPPVLTLTFSDCSNPRPCSNCKDSKKGCYPVTTRGLEQGDFAIFDLVSLWNQLGFNPWWINRVSIEKRRLRVEEKKVEKASLVLSLHFPSSLIEEIARGY